MKGPFDRFAESDVQFSEEDLVRISEFLTPAERVMRTLADRFQLSFEAPAKYPVLNLSKRVGLELRRISLSLNPSFFVDHELGFELGIGIQPALGPLSLGRTRYEKLEEFSTQISSDLSRLEAVLEREVRSRMT